MEHMEQRVWERVAARSAASPEQMNLNALMMTSAELAAAYRRLLGSTSGKHRETLRLLRDGELANLACLRGIAGICGYAGEKPGVPPAVREPAVKLLKTCYRRTRQAWAEYMARAAEPEFGAVFQRMAKREEAHCALIAELLGGLDR